MEYMGNTIRHEELENTIGHGELARQATVEKLTWQANRLPQTQLMMKNNRQIGEPVDWLSSR